MLVFILLYISPFICVLGYSFNNMYLNNISLKLTLILMLAVHYAKYLSAMGNSLNTCVLYYKDVYIAILYRIYFKSGFINIFI